MSNEVRRFYDYSISDKLIVSLFLLLVIVGYLMAMVLLYTSNQWNDKKAGLSVQDIAYNYYGNRSGTRLEKAVRGPMSSYLQEQQRHEITEWLFLGASEASYQGNIEKIIKDNCVLCHRADSAMGIPDFTSFEGIKEVAVVDEGQSIHSLVRVSHIHLFGIGLLLLSVSFIFRHAILAEWIKVTLIVTPFIAIFIDIASWFLTKWDPHFAYVVVISGGIMGAAMMAQIAISLFQIWFSTKRP